MRSIIAAAVVAACSAPALAQPFIQIKFEGHYSDGSTEWVFEGRAVFDAAAAFTSNLGGGVGFDALVGEYALKVGTPEPLAPAVVTASTAELTYYDGFDEWVLRFDDILDLIVEFPAGGFSSTMSSLPDDPASYAFAGGPGDNIVAAVGGNSVYWSPASGFSDGLFQYRITVVDDPNPPAPCPGDCDGNGSLNVDDIDCFVASFLGGCP